MTQKQVSLKLIRKVIIVASFTVLFMIWIGRILIGFYEVLPESPGLLSPGLNGCPERSQRMLA
jgi:hypothetical protein